MFWLASGVEEQIHEINLDDELFIEFIYAERLRVNNYNKIKVIGYNEKDEEVFSLKQLNKTERLFVGFKNEKPIAVKKLKFYNEDGTQAYVKIIYILEFLVNN